MLALERRIEADLALRAPRRRRRRARGAGGRTPAAGAAAWPADDGALPLGPPGRGARGLPRPRARPSSASSGSSRAPWLHGARHGDAPQDPCLEPAPRAAPVARPRSRRSSSPSLAPERLRPLAALAAPLVGSRRASCVLVTTVADVRASSARPLLASTTSARGSGRDGVEARAAVFTSVAPGVGPRAARASSTTSTFSSSTRPTGSSRMRECSRCSTRRPATSASSSAARRATGRCSSRSRGPSTTGPRSSSARGSPVPRRGRCSSPGRPTGVDGRDASRLLANASHRRAARSRRTDRAASRRSPPGGARRRRPGRPASSSSASPTAGAARASVGPAPRSRRSRRRRPCSSVAASAPAALHPAESETRFTWTIARLTVVSRAHGRRRRLSARLSAGPGRRRRGEKSRRSVCSTSPHDRRPARARACPSTVDDPREIAVANRLPVPVEVTRAVREARARAPASSVDQSSRGRRRRSDRCVPAQRPFLDGVVVADHCRMVREGRGKPGERSEPSAAGSRGAQRDGRRRRKPGRSRQPRRAASRLVCTSSGSSRFGARQQQAARIVRVASASEPEDLRGGRCTRRTWRRRRDACRNARATLGIGREASSVRRRRPPVPPSAQNSAVKAAAPAHPGLASSATTAARRQPSWW